MYTHTHIILCSLLVNSPPPPPHHHTRTNRGLFFGDYMIPGAEPRIYDEVLDFTQLTSTIEKYAILPQLTTSLAIIFSGPK